MFTLCLQKFFLIRHTAWFHRMLLPLKVGHPFIVTAQTRVQNIVSIHCMLYAITFLCMAARREITKGTADVKTRVVMQKKGMSINCLLFSSQVRVKLLFLWNFSGGVSRLDGIAAAHWASARVVSADGNGDRSGRRRLRRRCVWNALQPHYRSFEHLLPTLRFHATSSRMSLLLPPRV